MSTASTLAVTGVGLASSLGLDVVTSCAAARAGICRVTTIDDLVVNDANGDETALVSVHRVPVVSAGFFGYARLLQVGVAGLSDLLRETGPWDTARVGMVLVVGGETYRRAWLLRAQQDPALAAATDLELYQNALDQSEDRIVVRLLANILQRVGLSVQEAVRKTVCASAVGFVAALRQAQDWLARGVCDRCVIGGVDSLLDPSTLEALNTLQMLKTEEYPVGLMPGEAACFILVESPRSAVARGASVLALVESAAIAVSAAHPQIRERGAEHWRDALVDAISASFKELADAGRSTGLAVANVNGDPYRAVAWTDAIAHTPLPIQLSAVPVWFPPLSFGDTGAATGTLSVAMLVQGWLRRYAPSRHALVCLMDDFGERAAVCVRAAS